MSPFEKCILYGYVRDLAKQLFMSNTDSLKFHTQSIFSKERWEKCVCRVTVANNNIIHDSKTQNDGNLEFRYAEFPLKRVRVSTRSRHARFLNDPKSSINHTAGIRLIK